MLASQVLTIGEFRTRYSGVKPYFEYWHGEAVQKSTPKWLHSLIQGLVRDLLREAGYKSGVEIELRIDSHWQPVPGVIGAQQIEQPYPTRPVDVVVEILSADDRMSRAIEKCGEYSRIGIPQVLVIDPEHRGVFVWMDEAKRLVSVERMALPNGRHIETAELWRRLDEDFS